MDENPPVYENVAKSVAKERFNIDNNQCYSVATNCEQISRQSGKKCKKIAASLVMVIVFAFVTSGCVCGFVALFLELRKNGLSSNINEEISMVFSSANTTLTQYVNYETAKITDLLHSLNDSFTAFQEDYSFVNSNITQYLANETQGLTALLVSYGNSFAALQSERLNDINFIQYLSNETQQINAFLDLLNDSITLFRKEYENDFQQLNLQQNQTQEIINFFGDFLRRAGYHHSLPISSCAALPSFSPSGYYWVRAFNSSSVQVYCDMTRSCGGVTGGWMRVAELDMTNTSHQCPSGLMEHTDSNIRTCVSLTSSRSCSSSITFSTFNTYNRVCGSITGYQKGITNAFASQRIDINSFYVDGVSLTYGNPRQHIWTFAAARDETIVNNLDSKCPCILNDDTDHLNRPPPFVGGDYFCDTGSLGAATLTSRFYGNNALWDGVGCGPTSTCCSFNTPPWFYKQLPQLTTDNIEMRVCRDEGSSSEDIGIQSIYVYIQ